MLSLLIMLGLFVPHTRSDFTPTRKSDTLTIIPGDIEASRDWHRTHALYEQDVSPDGVLQSFTWKNAATLDLRKDDDVDDSAPAPTSEESGSEPSSDSGSEILDEIEVESPGSLPVESPREAVPSPEREDSVSTEEAAREEDPASDTGSEPVVWGVFNRILAPTPLVHEVVEAEADTHTHPENEPEGASSVVPDTEPLILSSDDRDPTDPTAEDSSAPAPAAQSTTDAMVPMGGPESLPTNGEGTSTSSTLPGEASPVLPIDTAFAEAPSITLTDFAIPPLGSGQFITNVQLRASLAALIPSRASGAYPTLLLSYSFGDNVWHEAGSVVLTDEVSNALNGGYFLFALPTIEDAALLESLTVRATVAGTIEEADALLIDAVWLEVDTETFDPELFKERLLPELGPELALPEFYTLLTETLDFARGDVPRFVLRYESQRNLATRLVRDLLGRDLAELVSVTIIRNDVGQVSIDPVVSMTDDGLLTIELPEEEVANLEPGTYRIEIVVDEGGKLFTDTLEFQWGLIAVNPDQATYALGDTATIALAALSPDGNTLCDADLALYVRDPSSFIWKLPIVPSGMCNGNNVVDVPDYTATFDPPMTGTFELYVEHLDRDGSVRAHTIDSFIVEDTPPFSILRTGQTRINPESPYSMTLTVRSRDGNEGTLTELVPENFTILSTDGLIVSQGIEWNIAVDPGGEAVVTYTYDAPDISPYLYTLGPASLSGTPADVSPLPAEIASSTPTGGTDEAIPVPTPIAGEEQVIDGSVMPPDTPTTLPEVSESTDGEVVPESIDEETENTPQPTPEVPEAPVEEEQGVSLPDVSLPLPTLTEPAPSVATIIESPPTTVAYVEHRAWQLASDATGSMILFWTDGSTIPSGWTCISCVSTSTFYQRFPLGGATYGSTGGTPTTTHTVTASVNSTNDAATSENRSGSATVITSHSHDSLTVSIGASTTLPAYRQLRVIQNNSAGTPATIPAGALMIFDGTLPGGWTRYTALDDRYPYGQNTILSSSTNTHRHTLNGTTSAAAGTTYDNRNTGTQGSPRPATASHVHTISTSTPYANHEPPYLEVIFATSSAATATPQNAITMWSDTPPPGWLNRSAQSGDPFYNRYIKGAATYGATGGSDTHVHSDFSATTSSSTTSTSGRTGTNAAIRSTHTHLVNFTGFSTASNTPPYVTVIYAKYYGLIPIYDQVAYRWYANSTTTTPTDPWPSGTENVEVNQEIDSDMTAVKSGDIVRLRLQLNVSNSTTTGENFKLQYGTTTGACTAISFWTDVGGLSSSTAWIGYNNAAVSDGTTLSSTTIAGSEEFGSYEETNPTVTLPNEIGIGEDGEWDFVLKQNDAEAATIYCFRMVEGDGTELFAYTEYPRLVTNTAPDAPMLDKLFDSEKVASTTPWFEWVGTDSEGNDLTYQVQVDDDYTFASVNVDRDTANHATQFSNLNTPADKDPYTNGETIRFIPNTSFTNGTTYYWRVRAKDPTGSNTWSSWSVTRSFTIDTTVTVSTWFQTTEEQFDTGTHLGTDALVSDRVDLAVGSTTGTTTSQVINFLDGSVGNAWGALSWNDAETTGDIKYRVQYYDEETAAWTFVPESYLSGNSAGFDTSPVSLLSLDAMIHQTIRLLGVFTNSGGSPSLYDWTVAWGYRIDTPSTEAPFPNEKVGTTTPTFLFETTDPQGDSLEYEIQWSSTYAFTASTTRRSEVQAGFVNTESGGDLSPFNSGQLISFTIQPADALTNGNTYWWRVRARDPLVSNQWSFYTDPLSITVDTTVTVSTWFQTTAEQFDTDTLSGLRTLPANTVTVATTTDVTLIAYAEGSVTTPRYRVWDGTQWGTEANALDVGASQTWVVTRASPVASEYILGTLGTDNDVNVQVYANGSWDDLQEITAAAPNSTMRGFDVAYETVSGEAIVVACDGDADPTYYTWDGTVWTSGGTIDLRAANACGWVKLISSPTSNEIILISRDTTGTAYETLVWNGSAWGTNRKILGSIQSTQANHEGIAAAYEDSGNQAVIVVSNGTNNNFTWTAWGSATWTVPATVALGDDFEAGTIASDDGTDNMGLCYIDEDRDIGVIRWNGSSWVTPTTEQYTTWTTTHTLYDDRPVDCVYEVGGSRDGYLTMVYATTTAVARQSWNGAAWSTAARVSTLNPAVRLALRRTNDNLLQLVGYATTSDSYQYTYWNGSAWSALQTLETDASAGATPYKEPFMIAPENPGIAGTVVVSPGIDFYDGSGPYWQQLSWSDSEPGGSSILYQVEYYDGDSWELVPDGLIPGNSTGTSTSPINLTNVLPVSTYNMLRPVASLSCNLGTCPTLSDWTLTWSAGITISGTARQYDQSTNVTAGTVAVAVNGVLQSGKTGTISGGAWSIANVNVSPGDIVTVFVNGANDPNEAVSIARYDGVGNMTGLRLYEQHVTIGSDDATTTPFTNASIGLYDNTNDEDLFHNATGTVLSICAESNCTGAELYIMASSTVTLEDTTIVPFIENNGTLNLGGTTFMVSRSWDNNATVTPATSTVVFTATSTTETIDETGAVSPSFYNLTFGTTTGSATWNLVTGIDVNNDLTITRGTLGRGSLPITIAGNMSIGASGAVSGVGTTTFDGTGVKIFTDSTAGLQNIGRVVVDGTSKTLQLGSQAKYQSLTIGSDDIFDVTTGNYALTILSSFNNQNTFVARNGTTTFAGTTTALTITAGGDAFYNLAFTGAGGAWSFTEADLSVTNDLSIATGTVTFPTGTTTISGSFANVGTFAHNNGTVVMNATGQESITLSGGIFTNAFYNFRWTGSGSGTFTEAHATTSNDFRITAGSVVFPNGTLSVGGNFLNTGGTFNANSGTVRFTGGGTHTIDTNAAFYHLLFTGAGSSSFVDTNVTATEDVTISGGTVTFPSGTFSIGGSLTNAGTITHNSGTVLLNSTDTGETVSLGSSSLYNLTVNGTTGGWTISEHATTTASTSLLAVSSFTLASGQTLSVGGVFTNLVGGASTTWTGSTLVLTSGSYSVNTKSSGGDAYEKVVLGANTDIAWWYSSAATYDIPVTSSLYSQDHSGNDGDLYIFGSYERTSGTEHWSYATDFDGTALATTSRQVDVRFASGATATFSTSTLSIVGTGAATTTIANQGSGTYTVNVTGGTTTASYYSFADLGLSGLSLLVGTRVTALSDGAFIPSANGGTGITVAASTIDANPELQIYRVAFSTTTPISASNVTQNDALPVSYWWFRESTGNIDGEAFDADASDPGSIRWDDSSLTITVSGTVYEEDTVTPLGGPTCGAGTPVRVVVEGGGTFDGACDGSGNFSIPGVVIVGDPTLTVFLNGALGGERAVTVTKTPTADVTDLDLYVSHVITRHEDVSPISISDMSAYDGSDDADILFTAATGTTDLLTVVPDAGLVVWATSTFAPGGSVVLQSGGTGNAHDGTLTLQASSTFTGAGTTTYAIGGSFIQGRGATFSPASSTVTMTATTSGKGITSESGESISLHALSMTGVGGGWNLTGALTLTGDLSLTTGTLTGTGNITLTNGSFAGNGLLSLGSGTTTIAQTNTLGGTAAWTFANLVLGDGSTVGTTSKASTATTTVLGKLTIGTGHFFAAFGSVLSLEGSGTVFVEQGTFVEATSTVRYAGTTGSNVLSTNYYNLSIAGTGGTPTFTATGIGIVVGSALTVGGSATTTFTLDTNDTALDVNGNVTIGTRGTLVGSNSGVFTVGGGWDTDGTFTASGGTVTFDGTGAHAIAAGSAPFSSVNITGTGSFTVSESATSTGTFTISSASTFTAQSGTTLAVGGTFVNARGGAGTTWTGSTLSLYGGTNYEINSKTVSDTYERLAIGLNTQIRTWGSSAATLDLAPTASLYSQDHAGVNGALSIYGAYVKSSGTDFWSYATDFDGTSLSGGSERTVSVGIASGGSVFYQSGELAVIGDVGATSTIANQGSGTYAFRIGGNASTTFRYYAAHDMDVNGLVFSGAPNVVNLSYGHLTVGVASGTAFTVGGTVINQNAARTFTNNTFSTSTGGLAFNVTATGTSASSWRFTNHSGSIDGEYYDVDPDGDPGYIVWDDSSASLAFSGRVYSDEGTVVSGVCDGATSNIHLRIAGLTSYTTSCNGSGQFTFTGVTYSPGDSFVVYIDGEAEKAALVSEDPVTGISNLDLYENRVIARHEGSDPLSIDDMALWDSSDDADIPFTAQGGAPDTLTLPANTKLIVWEGKEFEPGGNVTASGGGGGAAHDGTIELKDNAIFDATGAESHTIGGSLLAGSGASIDAETSTFTFTTSGAGRTIDTNDGALYNVVVNGSGSYTVTNAYLTVHNDLTITQGAVTLPTGTTTIGGSFLNTGGSFTQNGGSMYFTSGAPESIRTLGSSFGTTTFNGAGSWTYLDGNATSTGDFTILAGTVTGATGTLTIGGQFFNAGTYTHNSGTIRMTSSRSTTTITAGGSDLYSVTISGNARYAFADATLALLGTLRLEAGTTTLPTSTISIAGSLISSGGAFVHATGTVLMNSADAGETITPGNSTFTNLTIAAPTGGYTITDHATTTENFSLTSALSFTLTSGKVLSVGGVFTNLVGGAATTWAGTTIVTTSGLGYTINTKLAGGDTYNNLILGNNTDLRMWNSAATATMMDTLSSLYSQDNGAVDGELYIYGNYTRTTGGDYWSATTDFDGTAVGARAVTVRHAANATSSFTGGTLEIIGTAAATTTITNQGSGTYALSLSDVSLNAQYYAIRNVNASGMVLSGLSTITSLSNGDFELAVNGGALLTVSSTTLNFNAFAVHTGMRFATTSAITGVNIALVGTTASAWTLTSHRGNLDGEYFDDDGLTDCGSLRWDDSTCLLTEETGYRWRNDDGGEGIPNSEWYDQNWTKRKRITITNADATTYTNAVVEITVPYDADMQTDFDDLRVTSSGGTTTLDFVRETYTASTEATIWVEVPTLAASADTVVYLYYGNGGALYGGIGTTTFSVYDDFEDGNITEYSGDTSLFSVDTSLVYQGSYRLEATNPNDKTTDGIYRTGVTVSQGETFRFFQYVDTTSGSNDETCALFGVQTPGSNNQNYAVCLEQFGVDRVSISENVTDADTSGTVLATTSITYATGWYEVEVDWGTDDTIAVFVYQDDVLVATTSATDASYTSGGIGFTYWFQNGGWDFVTTRPLLTTEPSITLGGEQVPGGASWAAALNTPYTGVTPGTVVRPRFLIENTGLSVSDQYQLMYAEKGASPSCESVGAGSYTAVPVQASCTESPLCMESSTQFTNGALTTDNLGGDGTFTPGEIIEDPANKTSSLTVDSGYYTEVEYAVIVTTDATEPTYCLRVSDNGNPIDSYTKVAELGLVFVPNITALSLNAGTDIMLSPGGTTTITATGTVSDQNGYQDIILATTTMFRSGVGESCAADLNNCYIAGPTQCTFTNCAGDSCDISCAADFYYFADPTDASSTHDAQTWRALLTVEDQSGFVATATAPSIDLLTLRAFEVNNAIDYGSVAVNENTQSYNASTTFVNIGNAAIDVQVEGTDLSDGVSSVIPANEQLFATTTFTYASCVYCTSLSTSPLTYELDLTKPTTTTPGVSDAVYWGIEIPYGISAAPHYGVNTFYATGD